MDQARIAARLAEIHTRIDQLRNRNARLGLGLGFIVLSAATATLHNALTGTAIGVAAGLAVTIPGRLGIGRLRRELAALERAHPEGVTLAMDRYRLNQATERAERWKLFR